MHKNLRQFQHKLSHREVMEDKKMVRIRKISKKTQNLSQPTKNMYFQKHMVIVRIKINLKKSLIV